MEPYRKDEPAQNTTSRELFLSTDGDEIIPKQILNIEERESEEEEPDK